MASLDVISRLNAALSGHYEIDRELGEGGMATVYLAKDVKHNRNVALKVLKPELAAVVGAERFLGEIKTTANLQHPHILPLFDSGEASGFLFYVMPYVEGETLRERLDREVQLPVGEAVRIASAVANAVGYAHRQGVIHRDIKPANVLIHEGEPLVADFGIALAVATAGGARMTETGLSMGTPFYMSPEQASADRELGPQSDVYSVGCMLHEMLVGDPPHTGKTAQAVLAKILTDQPRPVTEMRATVPANVAAAVARSLERLPADRFESAEDFVRALADEGFTHAVRAPSTARHSAAPPISAGSPPTRWLPWVVAAAATAVAVWALLPAAQPDRPPTFRMGLSDFVVENVAGGWLMAISRDGRTVVAAGTDALLHVRTSDDPTFRPLAGTQVGRNPSISPDGAWVVFQQGQGLNKIQIAGGPVLPVVGEGSTPHWYTQEEIVYSVGGSTYRVSPAGGAGTLLTDSIGSRPFMLPGGRGVLGAAGLDLYVYDLDSGERTLIAEGGSNPRYVPTGHVLYGDRQLQSVLAVPFDLETLTVTGGPVPVLPSVNIFGGGAVQLAVSDNGTLVHGLSITQGDQQSPRLAWVGMDGTRTDLTLEIVAGQVNAPRISPDGGRVAYRDGNTDEIIVYDVSTGEETPVTDGIDALEPVWAPDGSSLYFGSASGAWYRLVLDGSSPPQEIASGFNGPIVGVSPDERWLVGEERAAAAAPDLHVAQLGSGPVTPRRYLGADWHEEVGVVSPDGRWLAYTSSEGDAHHAWIRSFPEPGPGVRVSTDQGNDPLWAPDGSALYYRGRTGMTRRDVRLGETVELGEERVLFPLAGLVFDVNRRMHDIHPDGDRFLFVSTGADPGPQDEPIEGIGPVVVVVNWFEELRAMMGGS